MRLQEKKEKKICWKLWCLFLPIVSHSISHSQSWILIESNSMCCSTPKNPSLLRRKSLMNLRLIFNEGPRQVFTYPRQQMTTEFDTYDAIQRLSLSFNSLQPAVHLKKMRRERVFKLYVYKKKNEEMDEEGWKHAHMINERSEADLLCATRWIKCDSMIYKMRISYQKWMKKYKEKIKITNFIWLKSNSNQFSMCFGCGMHAAAINFKIRGTPILNSNRPQIYPIQICPLCFSLPANLLLMSLSTLPFLRSLSFDCFQLNEDFILSGLYYFHLLSISHLVFIMWERIDCSVD